MIGRIILYILFAALAYLLATKKVYKTRSLRNRNPFNIRGNFVYKKDFVYSGIDPEGFIKFMSMSDGLLAGYRLLFFYFTKDHRLAYPVKAFVKRYSEGAKNYTIHLKSFFGEYISRDDIFRLGKIIVEYESGKESDLSESDFKTAYNNAFKKAK